MKKYIRNIFKKSVIIVAGILIISIFFSSYEYEQTLYGEDNGLIDRIDPNCEIDYAKLG